MSLSDVFELGLSSSFDFSDDFFKASWDDSLESFSDLSEYENDIIYNFVCIGDELVTNKYGIIQFLNHDKFNELFAIANYFTMNSRFKTPESIISYINDYFILDDLINCEYENEGGDE